MIHQVSRASNVLVLPGTYLLIITGVVEVTGIFVTPQLDVREL